MSNAELDDPGAFGMLVSSSQETNVKLVEVARWLTGQATPERGERDAV